MEHYCPHCGEPLKEHADFCLSCGKLIKTQPKNHNITYHMFSKTAVAIIGFFAIALFLNLMTSMIYRISMGYVILIPGVIKIILALLIAVIAWIENSNRQISKQIFIIALILSVYFILESSFEVGNYIRFWSRFR